MSGNSRLISLFAHEEAQSPAIPGAFPQPDPEPFEPRAIDVAIVKVMLSKGMKVPPEIVDIIVDYAEYWARTTVSMDFKGANAVRIRGSRRDSEEDKLLLRTRPIGFPESAVTDMGNWRTTEPQFEPEHSELPPEHFKSLLKAPPALEHPVRKIVFKIKARDQGWGGTNGDRNTYRGSWTWFEAGLERFDGHSANEGSESPLPFRADALNSIHPLAETLTGADGTVRFQFPLNPSSQHTVQRNLTAAKNMSDYEVAWTWTDSTDPESLEAESIDERGRGKASANGEFVRNLKLGDVVTLWGKARFMGWANNIDSASIIVYWAV